MVTRPKDVPEALWDHLGEPEREKLAQAIQEPAQEPADPGRKGLEPERPEDQAERLGQLVRATAQMDAAGLDRNLIPDQLRRVAAPPGEPDARPADPAPDPDPRGRPGVDPER